MNWLVDTNVLLRIVDPDHEQHSLAIEAVELMLSRGDSLHFTLPNLTEFWNVITRPASVNGLGISVAEAKFEIDSLEDRFSFLVDTAEVAVAWKRLIFEQQVKGAKVHDARLAASVIAHSLDGILTFNIADFKRYSEITALHPKEMVSMDKGEQSAD